MAQNGQNGVYVWDSTVRLFHWALVAAFFIAFFTEDEDLDLHVWAGYSVGALVVLRLIWGFIGSRHALFSDFVYGPRTVLGYLADLVRFRGRRYLGHSPAGGAMVVALLACLLLTVASGLLAYGAAENAGPLAPLFQSGQAVGENGGGRQEVRTDRDGGKREESAFGEAMEELHEVLANLTLALVIVHIGAVVLASFVHRENLIRAMITGVKPPLDRHRP